MAGTSFLATICAERLTKFLTSYSKVQVSKPCKQLRNKVYLESNKATSMPSSPEHGTSRYSLLHQSEKPKLLENIHGSNLGLSVSLQQVKPLETRHLANLWQRSFVKQLRSHHLLSHERSGWTHNQTPTQNSTFTNVMAKYSCALHRNSDYLKAFDNSYNFHV